MKRFVSVCMCVLIVIAMAVPAFAAPASDNGFGAKAAAALEFAKPYVKDGYRYYLCFYSQATGYAVRFLFTPDKIITAQSNIQFVVVDWSSSTSTLSIKTNSEIVGFGLKPHTNGTSLSVMNGAGSVQDNCSYFASDFSTAQSSVIDNYTFTGSQLRTVGVTGVPLFPVDTTVLEALLADAKAINQDGYSVSTVSALRDAIQVAEGLLLNDDKTASQVNNATAALQSAIDGLVLLPDSSKLQSLVSVASGYDSAKYSVVSFSRLETALSAAKSLLASGDYTSAQLDAAKNELQNAISGLQPEEKPTINAEMISPVLDMTVANFAFILPIACLLFGIAFGTFIIPRIVRVFTKG